MRERVSSGIGEIYIELVNEMCERGERIEELNRMGGVLMKRIRELEEENEKLSKRIYVLLREMKW